MTTKIIKYKAGYKYVLAEDLRVQTRIFPIKFIAIDYVSLDVAGLLTIKEWYASDGPSGPTIDTKSSMRAAFCHDALFQLMRFNLLDRNKWFQACNDFFYETLVADGMFAWRAWYWWKCVSDFSKFATYYNAEPKIIEAP